MAQEAVGPYVCEAHVFFFLLFCALSLLFGGLATPPHLLPPLESRGTPRLPLGPPPSSCTFPTLVPIVTC